MYPNRCEEPGCGKEEVTVILAAWYDDKLRCRDCYNTLYAREQQRLQQNIKQNVEAMQTVDEMIRGKRGQQ